MRKLIYLLCAAALFSCGSKERTAAEVQEERAQNNKKKTEVVTNIVGDTIADINLITRYGKNSHLLDELYCDLNLIVIYNPDEQNYRQAFDEMTMSNNLNKLVMDKKLKVVIIDEHSDHEDLYMKSTYFLPIWIVTADLSNNAEEHAIPTPYNPTFYLVNQQGLVILQANSLDKVIDYVERNLE